MKYRPSRAMHPSSSPRILRFITYCEQKNAL
jgi:hypothetical protein